MGSLSMANMQAGQVRQDLEQSGGQASNSKKDFIRSFVDVGNTRMPNVEFKHVQPQFGSWGEVQKEPNKVGECLSAAIPHDYQGVVKHGHCHVAQPSTRLCKVGEGSPFLAISIRHFISAFPEVEVSIRVGWVRFEHGDFGFA